MSDVIDKISHKSFEPVARLVLVVVVLLSAIFLIAFLIGPIPITIYGIQVQPIPIYWLLVILLFGLAFGIVKYRFSDFGIESEALNDVRPSRSEKSEKRYAISDSISFYNSIAKKYDARLTREYLDTLRETANCVLDLTAKHVHPVQILDIGAGTGQFVRQLEGARRFEWTCIEPAVEMVNILRLLFDGPPLHPVIYGCSLLDVVRYVQTKKFDVVTLNSVISSMPSIPNLATLHSLLVRNGVLIISDGHPDIRKRDTAFRVRSGGEIHELAIEHRSTSEIVHAITHSGLFVQIDSEKTITKEAVLYSYVLCFRKA
jgi:2-polyprenyl-3-methyl-5-hydroxy-6-metoxy-1,4-benzoquinol methylase